MYLSYTVPSYTLPPRMRCCPWYRAHLKWSEIVSRVNSPLVPLRLDTLTPLVPPTVDKIEVLRGAKVRRAKLYFLRDLKGKAARMKEQKRT